MEWGGAPYRQPSRRGRSERPELGGSLRGGVGPGGVRAAAAGAGHWGAAQTRSPPRLRRSHGRFLRRAVVGSGGQEGRAPPRSWGQPPGQPQHGEVRAESPAPRLGGGRGGGQNTAGGWGGVTTSPAAFWGWGGRWARRKSSPESQKGERRGGGAGGRTGRKRRVLPQNRPRSARMGPVGLGATGAARGRRGSVPPPSRSPPSLSFSFAFFFFSSLPPFKRQTPCREIQISRGKCRALIGYRRQRPAPRQRAAPGGEGP